MKTGNNSFRKKPIALVAVVLSLVFTSVVAITEMASSDVSAKKDSRVLNEIVKSDNSNPSGRVVDAAQDRHNAGFLIKAENRALDFEENLPDLEP